MIEDAKRAASKVGELARRSRREQWYALQAFVLLGLARAAIKVAGFDRLQRRLGTRLEESTSELTAEQRVLASEVGWAVRGVGAYTPWTSNCFPQALAAKRLLDRLQIPATVYLGAGFDTEPGAIDGTNKEFIAHAWLRAGEDYLTGGDVRDSYTPIVWYS